MSPCRDVPQPVYTPSRSTTRLLSVGGAASGDGVAVTAVVGAGAGVGAGVTDAGAGTGVVGAGELAAGDCAATVDSARIVGAAVSVFRFGRGSSARASRFGG